MRLSFHSFQLGKLGKSSDLRPLFVQVHCVHLGPRDCFNTSAMTAMTVNKSGNAAARSTQFRTEPRASADVCVKTSDASFQDPFDCNDLTRGFVLVEAMQGLWKQQILGMASINRILHVYVSLGRLEHACQTLETPPCEVDVKPPEHLETILT